MDMAEQLDEMTYHLLVGADSRHQALQSLAVVAHWAEEQTQRLTAGRHLRVNHATMVSEALHRLGRQRIA